MVLQLAGVSYSLEMNDSPMLVVQMQQKIALDYGQSQSVCLTDRVLA